ncbi:abortive infection family protein [Algoriphagus yeomjeoni]|uniref:Abortive infection Abi-like protein n=1 Tax=Algoriphagus yeomjeoni TaxID=291403 RepID=A0A327P743_9BACT|nr:abortive infection family protein [Algoriphagus yeomjeoni]RAI88078.1 abortive infection Abi-like protein [Algoriphagus yeomjeoni]
MAKLSYEDKVYLEKYLQMEGGWVLDFNNESLKRFIYENIKLDISDKKYEIIGTSKAKRLRALWDLEPDYQLGKLIKSFILYYKAKRLVNPSLFNASEDLEKSCEKIGEKLFQKGVSPHIDSISPIDDDHDFSRLAITIKDYIEKNEPELALDRLHTFYVKFIRGLCARHKIQFSTSESLNAIFGKYLKFVTNLRIVESDMTISILKYSINILEKFNDVRNNRSLAHDNKILNYRESLYIFDALARLKGFIDGLEDEISLENKKGQENGLLDKGDLF